MNRTDRNVIGWGFILCGIGFLMVSADIRHLNKRFDELRNVVNHNADVNNSIVDTTNNNMKNLKRYLDGLEKRINKKGE